MFAARAVEKAGTVSIGGGWALAREQRGAGVSYVPRLQGDTEPPFASADAWEPPHRLSVSPELCDAFLACGRDATPMTSPTGTYYLDCVPENLACPIIDRVNEANRIWWDLDTEPMTTRCLGLKRYAAGECHPAHQDLYPGSARRKIAGVVQLSHLGDYQGGRLNIHTTAGSRPFATVPNTGGTFVLFPGWRTHHVTPVTAWVRWTLCFDGWGPRLR